MTDVGFNETETRLGGMIVSEAVLLVVPIEPEIVTCVWVATTTVFTVNAPVALPALIFTVVGTVALVLLLLRFTTTPPEGAGPDKPAVPVTVPPPTTLVGVRVIDASVGGLTVRVAFSVTPLKLAPIDAV